MIKLYVKYFIAISLSLLFILYFLSGNNWEYKRDLAIKANSYIEGLKIVSKKNGVDLWVMTAARADLARDETLADMNSVAMEIPREGITINANSGLYNMNTKELALKDNIKIHTKSYTVSAKNLAWNPDKETLTSHDAVLVTGNKFRLEGEGLTATQDNKVTLKKNVKATFY